MKKLDLHMHSEYSDDEQYEPTELLKMRKAAGLDMIAIVDHDSVRRSRTALRHQQEYGITCIPAIEMDAVLRGVGYHILRYGIDVYDSVLDEIEEHVVSQEREASKCRRQLVWDMGIVSDEKRIQELSPGGVTTGKAIGEVVTEYNAEKKNPLLQPYYPGGERSDNPFMNFYWGICALGKPVYVEIFYPSVSVIMELFHQQNALVIVVHPGVNAKEQINRIYDLLQFGVDELGVFSSYHSEQQTQFYYGPAKSHGLYMACGSDFHGKMKSVVHIGMCSMEEEENTRLVCKLETLRI